LDEKEVLGGEGIEKQRGRELSSIGFGWAYWYTFRTLV
jgi:hypothetical protein